MVVGAKCRAGRSLLWCVLGLTAALALPSGAAASTVGRVFVPTGDGFDYQAGPGETNHVTIGVGIDRQGEATIQDTVPVTAEAGCHTGANAESAVCPIGVENVGLVTIDLGDANDTLSYSASGSTTNPFVTEVFDGPGNDTVRAGSPYGVTFVNGPGNDILRVLSQPGDAGSRVVAGRLVPGIGHVSGSGADAIYGGLGNDSLNGGIGNDRLYGGRGNDHIRGGPGNDRIHGGPGLDHMFGGGGHDRIGGVFRQFHLG